KPVLEIPYGQGVDHAEGIALFSPDGGEPDSILVVYDSACESRQPGDSTMMADVFALPQAQA
ncbi:MAG TPA: DUF3616 domain-containing protein, partial [Armatimonadota bacterium]|nr:DUF3616 domain-containing protein [Armatimonadota bacterium]